MKKLIPALIAMLLFAGCVPDEAEVETTSTANNTATETSTTETTTTPEEEAFNESGAAKAIEEESDLWQVYDNAELGLSFSYPQEVTLLASDEYPQDPTQTYAKIELTDIGVAESPRDLSEEEAMKNIEALSGGEFGVNYDNPFEPSKKVKTVGFLFAQDFMILSRFEVCDVSLERKLLFYYNNKQVIITLFGPKDTLKETMPEYFKEDADMCGDNLMWDTEKQEQFYEELLGEGAAQPIQTWFNQFDEMTETVMFASR